MYNYRLVDQIVEEFNKKDIKFLDYPIKFDRDAVFRGINSVGTDRELSIFSYHLFGMTYKEIGEKEEISSERVGQILRKLKRKVIYNWKVHYQIPISKAEEILRHELNVEAVRTMNNLDPKGPEKPYYDFVDFSKDVGLSVRTFNCIMRTGIRSVEELMEYPVEKLIKTRNFGRKSYAELKDALKKVGLELKEPEVLNFNQ